MTRRARQPSPALLEGVGTVGPRGGAGLRYLGGAETNLKGPFLTWRTAPFCVHQEYRNTEMALVTYDRLKEEGSL